MLENPKPKRAYNSTRRRQQADQTRDHIISTARKLFIERGYNATTLESIAQTAGVSVESIYSIFGNKKAILSRVVHVAVVGDNEPASILEREKPQQVRAETDQHVQVRLFAQDMTNIMSRVSPIFHLIRIAAETEPDMASHLHNMLFSRLEGITQFVQWLAANGPLRDNLTIEAGADIVWTLTSAEVYRLLINDRGWSADRYEQWIRENLTTLLLSD